MTYATRADLEQIDGPESIALRESMLPAGAVDTALVNADALIDGYLAGRYVTPLTVVPANLPQMAARIARYDLLGDAATERARNDYKDVIFWLTNVQAGRILIDSAAAKPGAEPATVVMQASSPAVFKRGDRP